MLHLTIWLTIANRMWWAGTTMQEDEQLRAGLKATAGLLASLIVALVVSLLYVPRNPVLWVYEAALAIQALFYGCELWICVSRLPPRPGADDATQGKATHHLMAETTQEEPAFAGRQ